MPPLLLLRSISLRDAAPWALLALCARWLERLLVPWDRQALADISAACAQEKWQGDSAVDAQGRPVFLWEETAMVNAARQVKAARPSTSVIAWLD